MNVIINPIETAISSCFLSTQESSVICTFNVEQKTESGSPISVTFSSEESSVQDLVRNVINNCILEKNSTTLFKIYFHEILEGNDLYSAYINCFSIVSVLSNVRISDTLASSSLYFENSIVNISLFLHQNKIMQCYIKDNIEKQKFVLAIEMCVEECRKHGRYIKNKIEKYFDVNHKGGVKGMLLHLMPVLCSYNVSDKTNLEQISFFEELKKCSVFLREIGVLLNKTTQAIDLLLEVEKCFCKKKSFSDPRNLENSQEKNHTFGVEKCYVFEFEDSNSCNDSSSSQCESSTNADDSEESTSKIKGSRKINGTLKTQSYYNKSEKVLLKKSNDMALHKYRNMSIVENLKSLSYRLSLIRKTENYRKSEKYIFKAISKYLKTSTLILHNIEHIYTTEMKAYDEDGSYSLEDLINWEIKNKVEVKETIDKIDQLFDELQPDDRLFEIIKDPSKNSLFSVIDLELKNLKENGDQMKNTKLFVLNVIDKINFDIKEIVNFVNCIRNKLL